MRDMTPPNERSIRNIPVPVNHRRTPAPPPPPPVRPDDDEAPMTTPPTPSTPKKPRSKRRLLVVLAIVAICIVLGTLITALFAGATVQVHPREASVTPPATIAAQLNAPVGTLSYQTVSVTRSASATAPATGTRQVSRQASGTIVVTNSYSEEEQRLIANTRFRAPDGKIYRIRESVVVPGATEAGTSVVPGTIEVTVYADSPGAEYNRTETTTFTIPGFEGDPRFEKFSGRSSGAISGGFVGTEPTVAEADLTQAEATLKSQLDAAVEQELASQVPEGHAAVPGTLKIVYSDLLQTAEGEQATISQTATATGAIVRLADLAAAIAQATVDGYQGEAVAFAENTGLNVTLAQGSASEGTLTLALEGLVVLVWQLDAHALAEALAGKEKDLFIQTLNSFAPAVACVDEAACTASIRPFWQGSFPKDSSKIKVVLSSEK